MAVPKHKRYKPGSCRVLLFFTPSRGGRSLLRTHPTAVSASRVLADTWGYSFFYSPAYFKGHTSSVSAQEGFLQKLFREFFGEEEPTPYSSVREKHAPYSIFGQFLRPEDSSFWEGWDWCAFPQEADSKYFFSTYLYLRLWRYSVSHFKFFAPISIFSKGEVYFGDLPLWTELYRLIKGYYSDYQKEFVAIQDSPDPEWTRIRTAVWLVGRDSLHVARGAARIFGLLGAARLWLGFFMLDFFNPDGGLDLARRVFSFSGHCLVHSTAGGCFQLHTETPLLDVGLRAGLLAGDVPSRVIFFLRSRLLFLYPPHKTLRRDWRALIKEAPSRKKAPGYFKVRGVSVAGFRAEPYAPYFLDFCPPAEV